MQPKFKIGQLVFFDTEYMYAALYPTGHSEITITVDGEGVVTDIDSHFDGHLYCIDTVHELPDGCHELHVDESDVMITHDEISTVIDSLVELA